jgi:hypothetical protein
MKSSNTVVTVIVIAAVLIAAYGVGLLIHQARLGSSSSPGSSGTDANRIASGDVDSSQRPRPGQSKDTPEARAKLQEQRAEAIEKMESATEEEKARFKERIREQVGGRRSAQKADAGSDTAQGHPPKQDPNATQKTDKTGTEPNAAGQG